MPYCAKCGVELEESARACPLCGTKTEKTGESGIAEDVSISKDAAIVTARRKPLFAVEVISVVIGIAAALCIGIDLWATQGRITWSLFVLVGLTMAWLLMAMPRILRKKPWLIFAAIAPSELLLLFLIDVLDGGPFWIIGLGMPIYLLSLVIVTGASVLVMVSRRRGLNVLGIVLAGAALECLGLESILSLSLLGGIALHWSPVVALACIPASGLAFYFHYRVIKKPLRRTFHL